MKLPVLLLAVATNSGFNLNESIDSVAIATLCSSSKLKVTKRNWGPSLLRTIVIILIKHLTKYEQAICTKRQVTCLPAPLATALPSSQRQWRLTQITRVRSQAQTKKTSVCAMHLLKTQDWENMYLDYWLRTSSPKIFLSRNKTRRLKLNWRRIDLILLETRLVQMAPSVAASLSSKIGVQQFRSKQWKLSNYNQWTQMPAKPQWLWKTKWMYLHQNLWKFKTQKRRKTLQKSPKSKNQNLVSSAAFSKKPSAPLQKNNPIP